MDILAFTQRLHSLPPNQSLFTDILGAQALYSSPITQDRIINSFYPPIPDTENLGNPPYSISDFIEKGYWAGGEIVSVSFLEKINKMHPTYSSKSAEYSPTYSVFATDLHGHFLGIEEKTGVIDSIDPFDFSSYPSFVAESESAFWDAIFVLAQLSKISYQTSGPLLPSVIDSYVSEAAKLAGNPDDLLGFQELLGIYSPT